MNREVMELLKQIAADVRATRIAVESMAKTSAGNRLSANIATLQAQMAQDVAASLMSISPTR